MAFKEKLQTFFGGTVAEDSSPDISSAPSSPSLDAVSAELRTSRKRVSKADRASSERQAEAEASAELDRLFHRRNWEDMAALYFRVRYVTTSFDGFLLTDEEKGRLGETLAMTMRILLKIDPAYIAIVIFGVTFSTTIVTKEMAYRAMTQKLRERNGNQPTA